MLKAHGVTYNTVAEAWKAWEALEDDNRALGASDGRVTEQNAIAEAVREFEAANGPTATTYEVVKDEFESPCDHPMCEQLHQRFMETHEYMAGVAGVMSKITERYHMRKNVQWLILADGERVGDVYDTQRGALAALERIVRG